MPLDTNIYASSRGGSSAGYQSPGVDYSTFPAGGASGATAFNLGNAGQVSQLSDLINSINTKAQQAANAARIPGAAAMEQQSSTNIGQELKGQVPSDVVSLLQQQAAERGVSSGVGVDSDNTNSAYLKALGLTSLQQEQTGQQNLNAAYQRNPGAKVFDAGSQVISPAEGAGLGLQAGQLDLANQVEADKLALQKMQLDIDAMKNGSHSPSGQGSGSYGPQYVTPAEVNYSKPGMTGNSLFGAPDYSTSDWWSSIGFTPGQGVTEGTGTTYMGDNPASRVVDSGGYDFNNLGNFYDSAPPPVSGDAVYG